MIVCPACTNNNPLGTRFCRACGAKLDVKLAQVLGSIETTKKGNRDDAIFHSGRSALTLCGFLLVCVVVFRALVVPAMPVADLPPPQLGAILPQEIPPPAVATAAPAGEQKRLTWRRDNAGILVGGLGADLVQLATAQAAIIATQKPEGTFPGADTLAATALMTLALQAYPKGDEVVAAAAKARPWLIEQCKDLRGRSPLARSLALVALLDAEELPESARSDYLNYLIDGKAPTWQAFGLSLFSAKTRPQDPILVRSALKGDMWGWYFDALVGKPVAIDPKPYFAEQAQLLKTGEERLNWAFTSWHFAAAPKDLAQTMSAWSRSTPPPVDPETEAKCGTNTAAAVWILTIAAPARVPPLWLSPR